MGFLDHFGHGEGFTRACGPKQDLIALAVSQPFGEFLDRGGLVASGFKFRVQNERLSTFQLFAGPHIRRWVGHELRRVDLALVGMSIGHAGNP